MCATATDDLLTPIEIDRSGPESARRVLAWVRSYLGTIDAEPRLGRPLVCPFIPGSLKASTLWIADLPEVREPEEVEGAILRFRTRFHELEPREGHEARSKTILVVFSSVTEDDAPGVVDAVQKKLKPALVTDDLLMIGELHPKNMTEAVGFPGQGIYPNRSPVPLLALRLIVPADFPKFLSSDVSNATEPEVRRAVEYVIAYHRAMVRWSPETERRKYGRAWQALIDTLSQSLSY